MQSETTNPGMNASIGYRYAASPFNLPLKDWLLYAYVLTSPFFLFSIFFSRDNPSLWVVILMTVLVLFESIRAGGSIWSDRSFIPLMLMVLVYALGTAVVYFQESGITVLGRSPLNRAIAIDLRLLQVVVTFVVFVNILADAPAWTLRRILHAQLFVGAILVIFGILQYVMFIAFGSTALAQVEPTNESFALRSNILTLGSQRFFRSMSVFSEPSFFGFFLIPLTMKAAVAWLGARERRHRKAYMVLLVCCLLGVFTNFAFTAVLSILILAVILSVVFLRRSPRLAVKVLLSGLALFILLLLSPIGPAVLERISNVFTLRDGSAIDRLVRVYTSAVVFWEHPWMGVGPGGYAYWYPRMGGLDRTILATPLNLWLSVLTDVGVVGFVPFVVFLWSIIRRAVKFQDRHPLVPVYLWSVIAYLVLMTTVDFWFIDLLWFELAMLLAVVQLAIREPGPLPGPSPAQTGAQ